MQDRNWACVGVSIGVSGASPAPKDQGQGLYWESPSVRLLWVARGKTPKEKLFIHNSFKYDLIQALNHVNQTQFFAAFSRLGLLCWYHSQGGFPWLQQLQTVSFQGQDQQEGVTS